MDPLKKSKSWRENSFAIKGSRPPATFFFPPPSPPFRNLLELFQFDLHLRLLRGLQLHRGLYTEISLQLPEHIQVSGHRVEFP
jgi:hypothetical protein